MSTDKTPNINLFIFASIIGSHVLAASAMATLMPHQGAWLQTWLNLTTQVLNFTVVAGLSWLIGVDVSSCWPVPLDDRGN